MKILVTGSKGFIGRNLIAELKNRGYHEILEFDRHTDPLCLNAYTRECNFVFHLAGVNRPQHDDEFLKGNAGFTEEILKLLKEHGNQAPIVFTSSIQADFDNPYGQSKKAAEEQLFRYGEETGSSILAFRLPNIFGKWSRPNYNTVVATYCYNITRGLPIEIRDPDVVLTLCYIDDVVEVFIKALTGTWSLSGEYQSVPTTYQLSLGKLADILQGFKSSRENLQIPDQGNPLIKKLYSTYLSFLPEDDFVYDLKMNEDQRGSFTEFLRTPERGQVSINISKPGVVKGNHWHHSKNEKFLVVSGEGIIRFRELDSDRVIECAVSSEKMQVVDIPTGYTHSIVNTGKNDLVTVMWVNECYDPQKPDTYYLEV